MKAHQDSKGVIHNTPGSQLRSLTPAEWIAGADALRRHHLGQIAALCLEAATPFALAGAQFLYAAGPFLGIRALRLARFLESEGELSALGDYLASQEPALGNAPGVAHD